VKDAEYINALRAHEVGDPIVSVQQDPDLALRFLAIEVPYERKVAQNLGAFKDA